MWNILRFLNPSSKNKTVIIRKLQKRFFMSNVFPCEGEWAKRLESPILQKVTLDDLFYEIDNKFQKNKKASAIDVDIFVNAIRDGSHLEEMEDLVHRLRLSSEACNIFSSTQHAFIRSFLKSGDHKELLRVLNDRLNYGIFPDDYLLILMMDLFIKKEDFTLAAKIGILPMLQEDLTHPLVRYLSLYSCHNYLLKPGEWDEAKEADEVKENEEEEEEVKVRVKYLRNSFFDDHFDLADSNSLIGKTLVVIGETLNNSLGRSYQLLGTILYRKWDQLHTVADSILNTKTKIYSSNIKLAENVLNNFASELKDDATRVNEIIEPIRKKLNQIKKDGLISEDSSLNILEALIQEEVLKNEENIIKKQCQIYEEWENHREASLRNALDEVKKAARLEEVKKRKEQLASKEEELFFFDREDDLDLAIENKKSKTFLRQTTRATDSTEYVPPEIVKRRSS